MSVELGERRTHSWLVQAVFALDRYLRRRQGTYEFSNDPQCLFRIEPVAASEFARLSDGTIVRAGDPVIKVHFWNEHMPSMGREGPTVGWARRVRHAIDISMHLLALHVARNPELAHVQVLYGDMRLGTPLQSEQFQRIIARYGFEAAAEYQGRQDALHRFGDTVLVLMLMLAINPAALRHSPLRRHRTRVFLTRERLEALLPHRESGG